MLSACKTSQPPKYFENITRDTTTRTSVHVQEDLKIKNGDILSVVISSISPENSAIFNSSASEGLTSIAAGSTGATGGASTGYIVDNEGNIEIIKLGKLHVQGLTKKQLKSKLEVLLLPYLRDPIVTIRFLNHKITVMGEVNRPQVVPLSFEEDMNIFQAILSAGDIAPLGKKDNILIVRTTDSGRIYRRIDLTKSTVFNSPYFYLQPDDIVYVEAKKVKTLIPPETQQIVTIMLSVLSLVLIFARGFK